MLEIMRDPGAASVAAAECPQNNHVFGSNMDFIILGSVIRNGLEQHQVPSHVRVIVL
jgi:hypothetical protein